MAKDLVIVESPAKAKTIEKYLGSGFKVTASMGHLRDLPKSRMGVDIDNEYAPEYIPVKDKGELIKSLKKDAKAAATVYLATDPDREGEAISWHLKELLDLDSDKARRVTFNEITKKVVNDSIQHPRDIDMNLVNAQQARRVLDRLVGYTLSPLLWKSVKRGLSAGRVQSVATRMVVDREAEINAFQKKEYWLLDAFLNDGKPENEFSARFYGINGKKTELGSREAVDKIIDDTKGKTFSVTDIKRSEKFRSPAPPFITSTLQQEASRSLNMTPRRTMSIAQQLYEGVEISGYGSIGLITYMRTDSLRLSEEALASAKNFIINRYGEKYYPAQTRRFKTAAGAQDAHEAIRPTDVNLTPEVVRKDLTSDQYRLYRLIWGRFTACQMANAVYDNLNVEIGCDSYSFKAACSKLVFPGYTAVYEETKDEESSEISSKLPELTVGQKLNLVRMNADQQFTQPPARYTEATLIRAMEEKGIGRPSTYAPTITTIISHDYVIKEGKYLRPTPLGETVTEEVMKKYFTDIVDLKFTNVMESKLDDVEKGNIRWQSVIDGFYKGFADEINTAEGKLQRVKVPDILSDEVCEKCGRQMVKKKGPWGYFLGCSGFPECNFTMPIVIEMPGKCPKCGGRILKKTSSKGYVFYTCERKQEECGFITWNVPTKDYCPTCGKTLFKLSGRGPLKSFCINEQCAAFVPEEKRSYKKKAKPAETGSEEKTTEKKSAKTTKKTATKKSSAKKPAAAKKAATGKKKAEKE